jgi:hypothetical protein
MQKPAEHQTKISSTAKLPSDKPRSAKRELADRELDTVAGGAVYDDEAPKETVTFRR